MLRQQVLQPDEGAIAELPPFMLLASSARATMRR